jgi:2-polyprenyl-3-methyl-5-hydroxy-6-metoxy-1,4-benzoquinol methylase
VVLADGSVADLRGLSRAELVQLQWDQEREFARRILAAAPGSPARAEATRLAYDAVTRIFAAANRSAGQALVMGLEPRYERVVLGLLARQRDRGLPVRMLEIGYAAGVLLERVARAGFPVAGIEVSEAMWREACRRMGPAAARWLHRGEFLRYEFPPSQRPFSLVYWNDVLEHVPPDEAVEYVRRAYELLVPGGALVTISPNWHIRPSDVSCVFCGPRTEAAGVHLKEYTLRQLTRLLKAAGFRRVATPWVVTPRRIVLWGSGMAGLKRLVEPALEWMPFRLARLLCRGFGLSMTIATK